MNIPSDAQQKIDAYLKSLSNGLRGIKKADALEIVEELRSHIIEKASASGELTIAGVDAALTLLGSPEDLARQYETDDLLSRVEMSRTPLRILESLFRWASLSVAGVVVLGGSLLGYFSGALLILCAILKPIHPQTAGLWVSRDSTGDLMVSMGLGFGKVPEGARDVLGWWIVPIGLLVGVGLVLLTTKFAAWCAGQYRRSRAKPNRG
jgi:hypothetical protein